MTIAKAIKVLEELHRDPSFTIAQDDRDAIKLGIEALKRLKISREVDHVERRFHLPGETED